jgi:hypothetical protein
VLGIRGLDWRVRRLPARAPHAKPFLNTQERRQNLRPAAEGHGRSTWQEQTDGKYYFRTGRGLRKSAAADWQRSLRWVFAGAEVTGNPHIFQHTFATDLLCAAFPIEDHRERKSSFRMCNGLLAQFPTRPSMRDVVTAAARSRR